jgi:hypothetical protein
MATSIHWLLIVEAPGPRSEGVSVRLPLIPPAQLTPQQKALYDEMRKGIASNFNAFKVEREDGALTGPWNPWLHEPAIGKAIWDFTLAMTASASYRTAFARSPSWSSVRVSMLPTKSMRTSQSLRRKP